MGNTRARLLPVLSLPDTPLDGPMGRCSQNKFELQLYKERQIQTKKNYFRVPPGLEIPRLDLSLAYMESIVVWS